MVGTTLREIRQHIERLASDDGAYYVVCARSGERPVPVAGQRFATRPTRRTPRRRPNSIAPRSGGTIRGSRFTIRSSVRLERRTRTRVPPRTVIGGNRTDESRTRGQSQNGRAKRGRDDSPLISFCHDVSGAVFEALSARDHDDAERAIMETYLQPRPKRRPTGTRSVWCCSRRWRRSSSVTSMRSNERGYCRRQRRTSRRSTRQTIRSRRASSFWTRCR